MSRALESRIKRLEKLKRGGRAKAEGLRDSLGFAEEEIQSAVGAWLDARNAGGEPQPPATFDDAQRASFYRYVEIMNRLEDEV